jgi:hypothetical protein
MTIDELKMMSNFELENLEDSLLLRHELDPQPRIKHTGGRFVLFALTMIIWFLQFLTFLWVTSTPARNPILGVNSIIGFFVTLIISIYASQFIWRKIGPEYRFYIRNIVHYWPVTLTLVTGLIVLFKG